ncbi:Solute carrier family 17 member 9 [Dirofilaria immitis]|nr:Solute carrier family 17 member 9 [Dirofilaria immitis]
MLSVIFVTVDLDESIDAYSMSQHLHVKGEATGGFTGSSNTNKNLFCGEEIKARIVLLLTVVFTSLIITQITCSSDKSERRDYPGTAGYVLPADMKLLQQDIESHFISCNKLWSRQECRLWTASLFLGTCMLYAARVALPGTVLSSFFWGYACTQVIAGYVADRVGAEKVLKICTLTWALLTFFTPLLFDLSYSTNHPMLFVILIRSATGIGQAFHLPSMASMTSRHLTSFDKGRILGICLAGSHLGTALAGAIGSILLETFGWRALFQCVGMMSFLWWALLRFMSSSRHQSGNFDAEKVTKAAAVAQYCGANAYYTLFSWLPYYFADTYPDAKGVIYNVVPSLAIGISLSAIAVCLLISTQSMSFNASLFIFTLAMAARGFHHGGVSVNPCDLAPNHTGSVFGVFNAFSAMTGFVGVYFAGYILHETGSTWAYVSEFGTTSCSNITQFTFLNFPVIAPNEDRLDLRPLDRDFHVLVHNANAVLAEQLAMLGELQILSRSIDSLRIHPHLWLGLPADLRSDGRFLLGTKVSLGDIFEEFNIHREANRAEDEPVMGGMERIAVGLIDELRNMIQHLIRQRDEMRQLVMQRGLFDPLFGSLESIIVDYLTNVINDMPAEAYSLPIPLLFEIHVGLYKKNKLLILHKEWSSIDQFQRILNWKMRRMTVHELFNGLISKGYLIERVLFEDLKQRILDRTRAVHISSFTDTLIDNLESNGDDRTFNFVQIQTQCASLWYVLGNYKKSMNFCLKALKTAYNKETHIAMQVELFCITAKILVFKRYFNLALKIVRFALTIVLSHPELERLLCSVLCDYGDCLLNSDNVEMAVQVMAKMVHKHFGTDSLRDGQAMYEYARAAYRLLYDNYAGYRTNKLEQIILWFLTAIIKRKYVQLRFRCEKYANKALEICRAKLGKEHYQLLNAEELRALVLVKSALRNDTDQQESLNEAMEIHMRALNKYLSFSSENANCARIYDYLGYIFRWLQKPEVSEEMFEKALAAKKTVYGIHDHEAAFTMVSLAYLYLKEMSRPREALVLFKKCLEIELNVFGEEYSGLGTIYDGMTLAYEVVDDLVEARICREQLYLWKAKRRLLEEAPSKNPFGESLCIEETFQNFALQCLRALNFSETQHSSDDVQLRLIKGSTDLRYDPSSAYGEICTEGRNRGAEVSRKAVHAMSDMYTIIGKGVDCVCASPMTVCLNLLCSSYLLGIFLIL